MSPKAVQAEDMCAPPCAENVPCLIEIQVLLLDILIIFKFQLKFRFFYWIYIDHI
jgi:hypothetical protein